IRLYTKKGTVQIQGNHIGLKEIILGAINGEEPKGNTGNKQIFIVHGHDKVSLRNLKLVLHELGLPEQYILQNDGGTGLTIIEELEKRIGLGQHSTAFGIVLLTPDDKGHAKDNPENIQYRARQNVILEMGMLLSSLGREKVAILKKGELEQPSDMQGILYLAYQNEVQEIVPTLARRLQNAGFSITSEAIQKASNC
ncbi:TPA: nucleotide-binding protein, partial [Pasteurella multocida]|nr:nucleotide-binding protein [Pasteurella multocida]